MKEDSDEGFMLYEDDEITNSEMHNIRDPLSGWPHEMRAKVGKGKSWLERYKYSITKVLKRVLP